MNIGLFGGTFDPVHRGHVALARAAMERCKLHRICFVPANIPPHKQQQPLSPFAHRFAMLALATAGGEGVCAVAAGSAGGRRAAKKEKPNYTIDTVRRLKQSFKNSDELFLLIGMDAFADIAKWHQAEALFQECEFIVAGRPGYSLADVANALPEKLRPRAGGDEAVSEAGGVRGSGAAGGDDSSDGRFASDRRRPRRSAKPRPRASPWDGFWTRRWRSTSGRWACIDSVGVR